MMFGPRKRLSIWHLHSLFASTVNRHLPLLATLVFGGIMALAIAYYSYITYHIRMQNWSFAIVGEISRTHAASTSLLDKVEKYVASKAPEPAPVVNPFRAPHDLSSVDKQVRAFRKQWPRLVKIFGDTEQSGLPPRNAWERFMDLFFHPELTPELVALWNDANRTEPISELLRTQAALCINLCLKPDMTYEEMLLLTGQLGDTVINKLLPWIDALNVESVRWHRDLTNRTEMAAKIGLAVFCIATIAVLYFFVLPLVRHYVADQVKTSKQKDQLEKEVQARTVELATALEEARLNSKVKSKFLRLVSHEVRTPMNGILGGVALLNISDVSKEQEQYIELVQRSAERMMRYMEDVIEMSRLSSGEAVFASDRVVMTSLLKDVIDEREGTSGAERSVRIVLEDVEEGRAIIADADRLRNSLAVLLAEAQGGSDMAELCVKLMQQPTSKGANVTITINYEGPTGLVRDMDEIFNRFRSSDLMSDDKSSSFGPMICKAVFEAMGGEVVSTAKPEAGQIITVRFTAPFAPELENEGTDQVSDPPPNSPAIRAPGHPSCAPVANPVD